MHNYLIPGEHHPTELMVNLPVKISDLLPNLANQVTSIDPDEFTESELATNSILQREYLSRDFSDFSFLRHLNQIHINNVDSVSPFSSPQLQY